MSAEQPIVPGGLDSLRAEINARLEELLPAEEAPPVNLHRAMRHGVLAPGKRLRPIVTLLSAQACGASRASTLDPACAVEMVHTASLVLDDLPSMDDANLRRGRSTTHVEYGQDIATLAAISLLNLAYGVLARAAGVGAETRLGMVELLSRRIGDDGVVAGQVQDLGLTEQEAGLVDLEGTANRKTGTLFVASAEIGAIVAGAREAQLRALRAYAWDLGLCFQILDDLSDATGTEAMLGKDVGQDAGRPSFVSVLGRERAAEAAHAAAQAAGQALSPFGAAARPLGLLLEALRARVDAEAASR